MTSPWQHLIDKHHEALTIASGIFTWTSQEELAWLAEEASKRTNILEIGTYRGASAKVMALSMQDGCHLTCFDSCPDPGVTDAALRNLKPEIDSGKVTLIHQHAGISTIKHPPHTFDMIWIDDGHTYEDVIRDSMSAIHLRRDLTTLICGHDCERHPNGAPAGAVAEALRDCWGWDNIKRGPGSVWYLSNNL